MSAEAPLPSSEARSTRKAVVLAAGAGTRMRKAHAGPPLDAAQSAAAAQGAKAMMPLGDRPFLDYVLHGLAEAGVREVILVVAPNHAAMREYYACQVRTRLEVRFAVQSEPKGTAHATLAAAEAIGSDDFLLINGDNVYPVGALRRLGQCAGSGLAAFGAEHLLAGEFTDEERGLRLRAFSDVRFDANHTLTGITEKPAAIPQWVSMNAWRLRPSILAACAAISPSPRGELELPDAVRYAIERQGERFEVCRARGPVLDLSGRGDVAAVSAALAGVEIRL